MSEPGGLDGLLLADKPPGPTSHDIVSAARRALRQRRIGHAGTLDPLASGLLILLLGRATRLAAFLAGHDKTYEGKARLGQATTTYDRTGEPVGESADISGIDQARLDAAAATLQGRSLQTPPPFSARKVGGERLYRRARRGLPVEAPPAAVRVDRFEVRLVSGGVVAFLARVSAGTYIRSLVHDLGLRLGCGAHMTELRRTASGPFLIGSALDPGHLPRRPEDVPSCVAFLPFDRIPLDLPAVEAGEAGVRAILNGRPFSAAVASGTAAGLYQVRDGAGRLVALASPGASCGEFQPRRVFLRGGQDEAGPAFTPPD